MADVERVARHLRDGHAAAARYEALVGDLALADLDEAYSVQEALIRLWVAGGRGRVAGWKIALTSKAMQEMCGVDQPCGGAILDTTIHHSPGRIVAADFQHMGLEFELAARMLSDVPATGVPYDAESIRPFVDTVMAAFELIEDRGADYGGLDALGLVADNAWNGGVVLGTPSPAWRDLDLETTPVSLDWNGETETAVTGAAMGNPLASVAWMANLLASRGGQLRAGEIVMTGSTMKTRFPVRGDRAVYTIDGIGSVEIEIV